MYLPAGLETREAQLKVALGSKYHRVRLEETTLHGKPATKLEYAAGKVEIHRTTEYGLKPGERFYILQFAAPEAGWAGVDSGFEAALESIEFFEPVLPPSQSTNQPASEEPPISDDTSIITHAINLHIDPGQRSLISEDTFLMQAKRTTSVAEFYISPLDVIQVSDRLGKLEHQVSELQQGKLRKLSIQLRGLLAAGKQEEITVKLRAGHYLFKESKSPVAGYAIYGQVNAESSYSSHVLYYPLEFGPSQGSAHHSCRRG